MGNYIKKEICAVTFYYGDFFAEMAEIVENSFKYFHSDIPFIKKEIKISFDCQKTFPIRRLEEVFKLLDEYKKVIFLGADTIICDKMAKIVETKEYFDLFVSLDYKYVPPEFTSIIPIDCFFNIDVTCFCNKKLIEEIIEIYKVIIKDNHYADQGAFNLAIQKKKKENDRLKICVLDHERSNLYYNVRSKQCFNSIKPDKNSHSMKGVIVKDDGIYINNKKIIVFHICAGLGGGTKTDIQKNVYYNYNSFFENNFNEDALEYFNKITNGKFKEYCEKGYGLW